MLSSSLNLFFSKYKADKLNSDCNQLNASYMFAMLMFFFLTKMFLLILNIYSLIISRKSLTTSMNFITKTKTQ